MWYQVITNKKIYVIKAHGKSVPFNQNKVKATCIRAGASNELAQQVVNTIQAQIHDGIKTKEIYKMVLNALSSQNNGQALKHRYRLKESIMLMGPAGFPFEIYVGAILENYGYEVKSTRSQVIGKCVKHEIDLSVNFNLTNERFMIECKYHNSPGIYTGLKDSLYTHARFLDLSNAFDGEMLVCNTKVSDNAITYANCIGQKLLCWKYPANKGLERMIEDKGLYPVTILGLSRKELNVLSQNKIMLAKELLSFDANKLTQKTGISYNRLKKLQNLVKQILG